MILKAKKYYLSFIIINLTSYIYSECFQYVVPITYDTVCQSEVVREGNCAHEDCVPDDGECDDGSANWQADCVEYKTNLLTEASWGWFPGEQGTCPGTAYQCGCILAGHCNADPRMPMLPIDSKCGTYRTHGESGCGCSD